MDLENCSKMLGFGNVLRLYHHIIRVGLVSSDPIIPVHLILNVHSQLHLHNTFSLAFLNTGAFQFKLEYGLGPPYTSAITLLQTVEAKYVGLDWRSD